MVNRRGSALWAVVSLMLLALSACGWSQGAAPYRACGLEILVTKDWEGRPLVVLGDEQGRAVPIWIGEWEAAAINVRLLGLTPPRPMTHDLMLSIVGEVGWRVVEVRIHSVLENTFYSTVVLSDGTQQKEVEARPSDAIALAVRADAPIRISEAVYETSTVRDAEGNPMPLRDVMWALRLRPDELVPFALERAALMTFCATWLDLAAAGVTPCPSPTLSAYPLAFSLPTALDSAHDATSEKARQ